MATFKTVLCRTATVCRLAALSIGCTVLLHGTAADADFVDVTPAFLLNQSSFGVVWFDYDKVAAGVYFARLQWNGERAETLTRVRELIVSR